MSIKKCLGLHQSLSRELLFSWLYELAPNERAEIFILRLLKKLADMGHRTKNEKFFFSRVSSLPQELILMKK